VGGKEESVGDNYIGKSISWRGESTPPTTTTTVKKIEREKGETISN
jgi:hypothetical protein